MTLTPETQKQVAKVVMDAWKDGSDPAERLERAGLLLHPAKKVEIGATVLRDIADLIEATPAQQVVPAGVPLSAGDIMRHVAEHIRVIAERNEASLKGK